MELFLLLDSVVKGSSIIIATAIAMETAKFLPFLSRPILLSHHLLSYLLLKRSFHHHHLRYPPSPAFIPLQLVM